MANFRIQRHPILPIPESQEIEFTWNGIKMVAQAGETIAAALFANGVRIFGHHHKDGSPQGIFCANGQCAQCMVLAGGKPVKSCVEIIQPGMQVQPLDQLPVLPEVKTVPEMQSISEMDVPVLIIGGGPAGLSAASELGRLGIKALLIDDKHRLGGKLVLQTHRFFGSTEAVYAGTRGIDIATRLEKELEAFKTVEIWSQSTALAVYSDKKVGILKNGDTYVLVKPKVLLVATGAREKFLAFKGNTLPGVYGAGAFQTLVNRDLVRPAQKLFIIGGGNVGLIAGYHALQAGIEVAGLAEALPECGGYQVHRDKLARMGVPIFTSHTILSANGKDGVESVTIARVDGQFHPIAGTERSFACDSVLIAVGLDPVDEFFHKAHEYGMTAFAAGDADEIAEASAAIFAGKIKGRMCAYALGAEVEDIPAGWQQMAEILKSKPGAIHETQYPETGCGVVPVIHCTQEIPCNPCDQLCPNGLISVNREDIRSVPRFLGNNYCCQYCERCVTGCPGLAITLIDYRTNPDMPVVSIPYEFPPDTLQPQDIVTVLDVKGSPLGELPVMNVRRAKKWDRTSIINVIAPAEYAHRIAGIQIQHPDAARPMDQFVDHIEDDTIICRCERVTAGEIRALIRAGYRDVNEIKTVSRAGMGACGSKTCRSLINRLFREEGVQINEIVENTHRPLFVEVPLGIFAGEDQDHA